MSKLVMVCAIILVGLSGCRAPTTTPYIFKLPESREDGLEVSSPEDVGLDPALLGEAVRKIRDGAYGEVHSMLIFIDGKLAIEEYFAGHDYGWDQPDFHGELIEWNSNERHNVHSVGKSITSACVGIAIQKGFIESVDDPIFDYLPGYQHLNTGGKEEITIAHLLTMTAGLEWDEWGSSYASADNDVIEMWLDCEDPVACVLEKPLLHPPGSAFTYSGGNMVVLGEIIHHAAGHDIEEFSWKYLFTPLGIESPPWSWISPDVVYAGGDQRLTSREMLTFGRLYLHNGAWNGQQILPEYWVEKSARAFTGQESRWLNSFLKSIPPGSSTYGRRGYSYTWWTHDFRRSGMAVPVYFALGFGGQKIFVLPQQDAVVVFTGGNYTSKDSTEQIFTEFILPALVE